MHARMNAEEVVTEETDDISLLLMMADKDQNRDAAEAALTEFFRRYQNPLLGFAKKSGFRALGWEPENFVLMTFEKAFEKIHSFDSRSGLSPEKLRLKIQSWLFQIAKHQFLMEFRKPERVYEAPTEKERADAENKMSLPETVTERFDVNELKEKKAAVRTFLEGLPKADQELLVISMNFYDFKAGKAIIPEDILEGLANSMGTTSENIKTKRGRLLRRLKEYLEKTTT
jgi:RNA polymerase sigma factor (sigma-70 family)